MTLFKMHSISINYAHQVGFVVYISSRNSPQQAQQPYRHFPKFSIFQPSSEKRFKLTFHDPEMPSHEYIKYKIEA